MKKNFIFTILAIFAISMVLTSCNSVESKAKDFVEKEKDAALSMDFEKLNALAEEREEYEETLSDEDCSLFRQAYETAAKEAEKEMKEKMKDAGKLFGSAMDELNSLTEEDSEDSIE